MKTISFFYNLAIVLKILAISYIFLQLNSRSMPCSVCACALGHITRCYGSELQPINNVYLRTWLLSNTRKCSTKMYGSCDVLGHCGQLYMYVLCLSFVLFVLIAYLNTSCLRSAFVIGLYPSSVVVRRKSFVVHILMNITPDLSYLNTNESLYLDKYNCIS